MAATVGSSTSSSTDPKVLTGDEVLSFTGCSEHTLTKAAQLLYEVHVFSAAVTVNDNVRTVTGEVLTSRTTAELRNVYQARIVFDSVKIITYECTCVV